MGNHSHMFCSTKLAFAVLEHHVAAFSVGVGGERQAKSPSNSNNTRGYPVAESF